MYKLIMPAIAAAFLFQAARTDAAEFNLTCAWDLGSKFQLKINDKGVTKNGRAAANQVSISENQISWQETALTGYDYDYSIDRHSGVLVASTFSKTYNRKVENKAICAKSDGSEQPGF